MINYVRQTAAAAGILALSLASSASWAATATYEFKTFFNTATAAANDTLNATKSIATLTATDVSGGISFELKFNSVSDPLLPEKSGGLSVDGLFLNLGGNGKLTYSSKDNYLDLLGLTSGYSSRAFQKDGLNYNWTIDTGGFTEGESAKFTIIGSGLSLSKLGASPMLDVSNFGKQYATGFLGLNDNLHFVGSPVAGIPEPATYAMLGLGLAGIGFVARRRQQA